MPLVRRYPLALIALLAVCVGCSSASKHEATSAPSTAATATVSARVVAAPARVSLPAHVTAHVAAPVARVHVPAGAPKHQTATATAVHAVAAPRAAQPRTSTPTTTTTKTASAPSAGSYPYATSTTNAQDAWGFTQRQCVSYAAWRLSTAGDAINNKDGWGNASNWDDAARRLGRTVSTTPFVGAVAQWNAGESSDMFSAGSSHADGRFTAGSYGHVGYVTAVYSDGSVDVAQYNATGDRTFSSMRMRAPRYL